MFHRIQLEDWHHILSLISFVLFFTSFCIALFRVFSMRKNEVSRMENLPLESEQSAHE
jgi:hypothetical protein